MLPQSSSATNESASSESHDPLSSHLSISTALKLSLSGVENMDLEGESTQANLQSERDLLVPADMPVDLRVKLAIVMINMGEKFSEVTTIIYGSILDLCLLSLEFTRTNFFQSRRLR